MDLCTLPTYASLPMQHAHYACLRGTKRPHAARMHGPNYTGDGGGLRHGGGGLARRGLSESTCGVNALRGRRGAKIAVPAGKRCDASTRYSTNVHVKAPCVTAELIACDVLASAPDGTAQHGAQLYIEGSMTVNKRVLCPRSSHA